MRPASKPTARTPADSGEIAFALGVVALGIFTLLDATRIVVPSGSAGAVGPRGFPYLIGIGLVGTGIGVLVTLLRGRRRRGRAERSQDAAEGGTDGAAARTDWWTLGRLALPLVFVLVALEWVGWPLAATVVFAGTAHALQARPWWRPALLGLLLGSLTYVGFDIGLGISLPLWPLAPWGSMGGSGG